MTLNTIYLSKTQVALFAVDVTVNMKEARTQFFIWLPDVSVTLSVPTVLLGVAASCDNETSIHGSTLTASVLFVSAL